MDGLFEATFSPVATTAGKNMSKCGRCSRYMRFIPMRPQVRIFFFVVSAVFIVLHNSQRNGTQFASLPFLANFLFTASSLSHVQGDLLAPAERHYQAVQRAEMSVRPI